MIFESLCVFINLNIYIIYASKYNDNKLIFHIILFDQNIIKTG